MSNESNRQLSSGYPMLAGVLIAGLAAIGIFISGVVVLEMTRNPLGVVGIVAGILLFVCTMISLNGFFTLLPNEACVLTLFGTYVGTAKVSGFYWTNPFVSKRKISQRLRNLEGARLKVNDKLGNPIEIAAVVVWRVEDTVQACFDVEDFEAFVRVQSESAVRHLANSYAYDHGEENEVTLRSGMDEVSVALRKELHER